MVKTAKWNGEWYFRKKASNWRNARTGKVSFVPRGKKIRREPRREHIYGFDTTELPKAQIIIRRRQ